MRIATMLIVLILTVTTIGIITQIDGDYTADPIGNEHSGTTLQYGEYLEVGGLMSATGAIERVEYDGKTYIHAIDVGTGSATIHGVTEEWTVTQSELYMFVLAGQSQAAYRNYDVTVANEDDATVRGGQAWYYGTSSQPVKYTSTWASWDLSTYGIYPMNNPDGSWCIGSLEAPFASEWVNTSGKNILILNTAISGRAIESFVEGADGWKYTMMILDDAANKLSNHFTVHKVGVIWLHGQANLNASVEYYVAQFGKVYDQYATEGYDNWAIEQPRASEAPTIDKANLVICDTYPNCYIGSTFGTEHITDDGPYIADGTHYNQKGRDIVGKELAECYLNHIVPELAYHTVAKAPSIIGIVPVVICAGVVLALVRAAISRKD